MLSCDISWFESFVRAANSLVLVCEIEYGGPNGSPSHLIHTNTHTHIYMHRRTHIYGAVEAAAAVSAVCSSEPEYHGYMSERKKNAFL